MKMVYIASPFRGDYDTNLTNAMTYCRIASELGVLPVASHIMYGGWCRDDIPEQREMGIKLGLDLLQQSEELWVMGTHCSDGMKQEIAYAKHREIPTYHVEHPLDPDCYPVSQDGLTLLCEKHCIEGAMDKNIEGELIALPYDKLKPQYRTPRNQLWKVTHGSGCRPGSFSDTVHLEHPLDLDRMTVSRNEICGVVSPRMIETLHTWYPELIPGFAQANVILEREGLER